MKVRFLALIILLVSVRLMGQNSSIDSLTNLYTKSQDDQEKIQLKCKISQGYTEIGNFRKGGEMAENAFKEATAIGYKKGEGLALYALARLNQYMRDWDNALLYHYQAIQLFDEVNAEEELAWSYLNMGIAFDAKKEYERAIRYDNKALDLFKKTENKQGEAYSYLNLGLAIHNSGNEEESFAKLKAAKEICIEMGDSRGVGYVHNILGDIFLKTGKLDEALQENIDCIPIREKENDKRDLSFLYGSIGNIYYQKQEIKKSEEALIKAEKFGLEAEISLALRDLYLTWSKLDSLNNNYKAAFTHLKAHNKYAAIIIKEDREREVIALKYAFKKDKEAEQQQANETLQETQEKLHESEQMVEAYKSKYTIALSVGALTTALLLFFLVKRRR